MRDTRRHILAQNGPLCQRSRDPGARSNLVALPDCPLGVDLDRLAPRGPLPEHLRLAGGHIEVLANGIWSPPRNGSMPDGAATVLEAWAEAVNTAIRAPLHLHRLVGPVATPADRRAPPALPPRATRAETRTPAGRRAWRRAHGAWLADRARLPQIPPLTETPDWFDTLLGQLRSLPIPGPVGIRADRSDLRNGGQIVLDEVAPAWATATRFVPDPADGRLRAVTHPEMDADSYARGLVASLLLAVADSAFAVAEWDSLQVVCRGDGNSGRPLRGSLALERADRELTLPEMLADWPARTNMGGGRLSLQV